MCWLIVCNPIPSPLTALIRHSTRRRNVNSIQIAPNRAPYITICLNNEVFARCLIDTGSVFSIIDSKVFAKLKNCKVYPSMVTPIAANGSHIHMLGTIFVNVKFSDIDETVCVYIQDGCTSEFILEINFLNRFKNISFLWSKSVIRFLKDEVPCQTMYYNAPTHRGVISLQENLIIELRTVIRTIVSVSPLYSTVDLVQFEPFVLGKTPKIYLASSVSSVIEGKIPVKS